MSPTRPIHIALLQLLLACCFSFNGLAQTETTYFSLAEALKHPDDVYQLDLSYQNLKEVPLSLAKFTRLKRLNLSHNQLTRIPKGVLDNLTDLRRLHLDHNRISELPEALFALENLKKLYLDHNQLRTVSPNLARLTNLKRLSLNDNKLDVIPIELLQLPELEWLDLDDRVFLNTQLDSLSAYEMENWKTISKVPDSIAGLPLAYYLAHPAIDALSKLFVQDRYALRLNVALCPFMDSLFTQNEETAPFYTYLYFDVVNRNLGSTSALEGLFCAQTKRLLTEQPCAYIRGMLEYGCTYCCTDDLGTLDAEEHARLVKNLAATCSELLEDRENLYFNFLNRHLPEDEMKGLLSAQITLGDMDPNSQDAEKFAVPYVMILSSSEDPMRRRFEYVSLDERVTVYDLRPGVYTLSVYSRALFSYRRDELTRKCISMNQQHYGDEFDKRLMLELKNESLFRIEKSIASIDERTHIVIPVQRFVKEINDSAFVAKEDSLLSINKPITSRVSLYDLSIGDTEHESRISVGECDYNDAETDSSTLARFLAEVYAPAMKNNLVPAENKKFLEQVKAYLIQRAEISRDSIHSLPFPLMAAYEVGMSETEKQSVRILDGRGFNNWSEEELQTYDYHSSYRPNPMPDSAFHTDFMGQLVNVHYDNGQIRQYRLTKHLEIRDACTNHQSYELYQLDTAKVSERPVFASFSKLALELRTDTLLDQHMETVERCHHSYCDVSIPQASFARLKGVPELIFTTDQEAEWSNWYPGRSLYMKLSDGQLIELWEYEVEYVECSCI